MPTEEKIFMFIYNMLVLLLFLFPFKYHKLVLKYLKTLIISFETFNALFKMATKGEKGACTSHNS